MNVKDKTGSFLLLSEMVSLHVAHKKYFIFTDLHVSFFQVNVQSSLFMKTTKRNY